MKFVSTSMVMLALAAATMASARPAVERMPATTLNGIPLPFSEGVRVENILYLSGQIGVGADGKPVSGFDAQARTVMDRITASLKREGLGWKDVIRCAVFLADMADWPAFNTIYATYLDPAHLPARSAFGTSGLALGALLEVQCDAYDPPK